MQSNLESTSSSLLRAVAQGDAVAWKRFADIYTPLVYGWMRSAGLQETEARDICQQVFLSVVKSIASFRQDDPDSKLRAWLRTIARNTILNAARDRERQLGKHAVGSELWRELPAESESAELPAGERAIVVRRALEIVRPDFEQTTWDLFTENVLGGHSAQQIAATRKLTVWAVYKARSRVLSRLQEVLADLLPESES